MEQVQHFRIYADLLMSNIWDENVTFKSAFAQQCTQNGYIKIHFKNASICQISKLNFSSSLIRFEKFQNTKGNSFWAPRAERMEPS